MEWLNTILAFLAAYVTGEMVALPVFYIIRKKLDNNNHQKSGRSLLRGMLERLVVLLGLAASLTPILVFFSAIKLGTRLKEEQDSKISNDYFLIGNMASISIAILELLLYEELIKCIS